MRSVSRAATPQADDRAKFVILLFSALTILGSYYAYDSIAPVADLLRDRRGFSQSQIGALNAVFSLPNIPLAIFGGVLIDRIGAARATLAAATVSALGAILTAVGEPYQLMLLGRLLFGLGHETLYIALLVGLAQAFHRGGSALAIALFFSTARVGSFAADTSTSWARELYDKGWQPPLMLAAALASTGVLTALVSLRIRRGMAELGTAVERPAPISLRDLRGFGPSFWCILWLNVIFASVFFTFRSTFSIEYFQDAKHISRAAAGSANSWVFLAAIVATPICGMIADRIGKRATLLAAGAALMPLAYLLLALTDAPIWVSTALMGTSFSVIPAVIWPSTAMLVAPRRIGTAFGLINMLQSTGLFVCNWAAGWLNDTAHAGPANPAGYVPMLGLLAGLAFVGLFAAILLQRYEAGQPGGGIEQPQPSIAEPGLAQA